MTTPIPHTLTRRRLFALSGAAGVSLVLSGCGDDDAATTDAPDPAVAHADADFEARFAGFPLADDPEGDLAAVVWPPFVTEASPEIRELYAFHVTNGGLMRYMPCFCGCNAGSGHLNNRDCYVREVLPDGSIIFDAMAPT